MSSTTSPASDISGEAPPHAVEDFLGILQFMSDGTVMRAPVPLVLAEAPLPPDAPVQWKDVVYDEANRLSLGMYVPSASTAGAEKLPVMVYFHSGAFLCRGFAVPETNDACLRLAAQVPSVVLRRPPPPRGVWRRRQPLLLGARPGIGAADFGRVFVFGNSSGANMAHQLAVRVGTGKLAAGPARVAGCVLLFPYFGGEQRTASEASCPAAGVFPTLALYDQVWLLALPVGASRDHPAANPFGADSPALDNVELPPVLVTLGNRDMLLDRIRDNVAKLKATGTRVELVELAGQGHKVSREAMDEVVPAVRLFAHGGTAEPRT